MPFLNEHTTELLLLEYLWNCGIGQDLDSIAYKMNICFPETTTPWYSERVFNNVKQDSNAAQTYAPCAYHLTAGGFDKMRMLQCLQIIAATHQLNPQASDTDFIASLPRSSPVLDDLPDALTIWMRHNLESYASEFWSAEEERRCIKYYTLAQGEGRGRRGRRPVRKYHDAGIAARMRATGSRCTSRAVRWFIIKMISTICEEVWIGPPNVRRACWMWCQGLESETKDEAGDLRDMRQIMESMVEDYSVA
ncbi:MAG: hypothetical protein MMC33_008523 [Icmadophila ericetorum]|nr:hypothetical protein [Icmadophila ericetorum]